MDALSKLKSIQDNVLGDSPGFADSPESFLESPQGPPSPGPILQAHEQRDYTSKLNSLANKVYGKSKQATFDLAWRCLNCNTLNGVQSNTVNPRKTCSKCARARNNNLTLKQEFLVRILIDVEGLSLEEATERILNG